MFATYSFNDILNIITFMFLIQWRSKQFFLYRITLWKNNVSKFKFWVILKIHYESVKPYIRRVIEWILETDNMQTKIDFLKSIDNDR